MAGRGLGGHRVEEGVKEEPQDDPDGEAHQHPAERQRPMGQDHRGEDDGDHYKGQCSTWVITVPPDKIGRSIYRSL